MSTSRKNMTTSIKIFFYCIICIPHLLAFVISKRKKTIQADVKRWMKEYGKQFNTIKGIVFLLAFYPEFRNLFYYRIGFISNFLNIICPKMNTLFLTTNSIGEGLFIQHGFATVVAADSIGKNCWINQQVTIGFSNKNDCPVIGDNVVINAGAKVIGGITIGHNSRIGANAVVVKNVPENCVVAGVPAKIIKRNGIKVDEKL